MRNPTQRRKPKKSQLASFPTPTAGLIRNRNLAIPTQQGLMPGACVLRNWFPSASAVTIRRGSAVWVSLPSELDVTALWTYDVGSLSQMFAATDEGIWDTTISANLAGWLLVTEGGDPIATEVTDQVIGENSLFPSLFPATSGDWSVLQFATAGGTYLIGVNGVDTGFIYDGDTYYPYVASGAWRLGYDAMVTPFVAGEVVTGGTSGATATVWAVDGAELILTGITGTFQNNEALTGSIAGSATVNGTAISAAPGITGMNSADMAFVWAYKQRVYFIEAGSMNAWYLPVDQVGGAATLLPLGGVFALGGELQWGQTWSLNNSGDGGLSEQCVFTTTEGEVAAFQGLSPDSAATWDKVGVYRIGRPLGKKAFMRAGGDLLIATSVGLVSLGAAAQLDLAALGSKSVSYSIEDLWAQSIQERGDGNWNCRIWPDGQAVYISPPTPINEAPILLVANANTGAWCEYTGWNAKSMVNFNGRFFFGSAGGRVIEGNVSGADLGLPYTADCLSLFDDLKSPGSRKVAKVARIVKRGTYDAPERVSAQFDYIETLPPPPDAPVIPADSTWDNAIWDEAIWNASRGSVNTARWQSVGGSGHVVAMGVQVTSGGSVPLDIEILRSDLTIEIAEIIT